MANIDFLNLDVRKKVIDEINGSENKARKAEGLRRFEIYRERQERYLIQRLKKEFTDSTISNMRKISSINLTKRITDEQASIYNSAPVRNYLNSTDQEKIQLDNLYLTSKANNRLKLSNRYFKLLDQGCLQIIPRKGLIQMKPLASHMYDVIPDSEDPELPYAYIISTLDKYEYLMATDSGKDLSNPSRSHSDNLSEIIDHQNQSVADADDYKSQFMKYVVWTDGLNFVMDSKGNIIGEMFPNPIGMLPFIDIADEKDMEFFVRRGNGIVDFSLDFSVLLSDTATINKLQGYAQAIVYAEKLPENMVVGPNHVLFMKLDPNKPDLQPRFEFQNPSPDMGASLELLETSLRLFLTSRGVDPKTVSGKLDTQGFSSGIERLLSMIEKFEASSSDFELFKDVEHKAFKILTAWSNALQGTGVLIDKINKGIISEKVDLEIIFSRPEALQTQSEKEDSIIKLLDAGLKSKVESIMELRGINKDDAIKIVDEIETEALILRGINGETSIEENPSLPEV